MCSRSATTRAYRHHAQAQRYSMYLLKAYGLPAMYWNGMLRGLA
jgi:hypothetical protein